MNVRIVRAGLAEAQIIARFNQQMAEETEDRSLAWELVYPGVVKIISNHNLGFYLTAVSDENQVVGCLAITYEWSDWRNGLFWWIQSVYVEKSHRGLGVFSAMYSHVKSLAAKQSDVCGIRLYVEKENINAQATYKGLGMIETHYRIMEEEFKK